MISKPSKRYAKAFLDFAASKNCLDEAGSDLVAVGRTVRESPELAGFIGNAERSRQSRFSALEALFRDRVHPQTWRFISFLAYKNRIRLVAEIAESFALQLDAARGIARAEVSTAFACAGEDLDAISGWLGRHCGKRIEVRHAINSSLIGGFWAKVADTVYDGSVAGELNELKSQMTRA